MNNSIPLIIVPDTHGHLQHVEALLKYARRQKLLTDHRLLFLGDYFDRGPQVKDLIDLCIDLQRQGHIFLCGNHEYTLERLTATTGKTYTAWVQRWADRYQANTLFSYGFRYPRKRPLPSNEQLAAAARELIPESHWQFIRSLPLFFEDEEHICVHAGLFPYERWPKQRQQLLSFRQDHQHDIRGPSQLFSSDLAQLSNNPSSKQLITAHVAYQKPWVAKNRVLLHCGVDSSGPLVALITDTQRIITVS